MPSEWLAEMQGQGDQVRFGVLGIAVAAREVRVCSSLLCRSKGGTCSRMSGQG
jgi:hypothetical protein